MVGRFIVFDGPDGAGKSTQIARLADALRSAGRDVVCVREPGGTEVGERVRAILLDPAVTPMSVQSEMLLYMASRAQLVDEVIRPALDRGAVVIADRFVSATLAYQGAASGLSSAAILGVARVAVGDTWPDRTVILDVDVDTAARRRGSEPDRIEQRGRDYHERVRRGFLAQAAADAEQYVVIDASRDPDQVHADVVEALALSSRR